MLTTIQFDAEVYFCAEEIEHVGLDGMLTAEFAAVHATISQNASEVGFGIGCRLPKLTGEGDDFEFFFLGGHVGRCVTVPLT